VSFVIVHHYGEHSQGKPSCHPCQLSLSPLVVAASALEAYPVADSIADLTDVHDIEGSYIYFRLKAKIIEANFTACAVNGRAGYRIYPWDLSSQV